MQQPYRALVIGASGAIGSAFVDHMRKDPRCERIDELSRSNAPDFDLANTASIASAAAAFVPFAPYDLIIDATGALTLDGHGPEKSLAALNEQNMLRHMQVNAISPLLLLRSFAPLLRTGSSIYAKLSARVGSITDNTKGGWYSYRASKAALNMFLQTAALELQRKNPALRVVAMQPGTVRSKLSQPFAQSAPNLLEPHTAASGLMQTLFELETKNGAHFVDWQGKAIAW